MGHVVFEMYVLKRENLLESRYIKERLMLRLISLVSVSMLGAVLFSSAIFLPVVGFFFYFFSILPFIYLFLDEGYKRAFLSLLISSLVIYVSWGKIYTLFFPLVFGSIGLFFGYSIEKKYSALWLVVGGSLLCFAMFCFFEFISLSFFHYDVFGRMVEHLRIYDSRILEFYKEVDIPPDDLENLLFFLKEKMEFLEDIFFSVIVLGCFLGVFMLYKVARALFTKLGYYLRNLPLFSFWRPEEKLIFGFIAGGVFYWVGFYSNCNFVKFLGQNVLVIYIVLYFISGLSLLSYFCKKYKIQKMTKYLFYALTILQPILLVGFGLMDVWVDFRKKHENKKKNCFIDINKMK
ncbi:DUF2232 domain-containing protein [bacterium]|nr:DUF2232 domain-containing protein [bacterium]